VESWYETCPVSQLIGTYSKTYDKKLHMPHIRTLGLALLFLGPFVLGQTQSQDKEPVSSQQRPLLELDLRKYGFTPLVSGRLDFLSLDFVDDSHLVFAWTTLDNPVADKKKKVNIFAVPSHLHAIFLDAHTGQKQDQREWPSSSFSASLYSVGEGKLLTCTGNAVRLLSREFETLREQLLTGPNPCVQLHVSMSKRSFSIADGPEMDSSHTLMDAETFAPRAKWNADARIVTFTDTLLVGNSSSDNALRIRKLDQPWEPLHFDVMEQHPQPSRPEHASFVGDSTLLIGSGKELTVVSVDGAVLFRINPPDKLFVGSQVTSIRGETFALREMKMRGLRNENLDMYPFASDDILVVYSLSARRAICSIKLKGNSPWPSPTWGPHDYKNQLALSPTGRLIAIVNDGILKVYQIPEAKS
jgi:hypothetical protein